MAEIILKKIISHLTNHGIKFNVYEQLLNVKHKNLKVCYRWLNSAPCETWNARPSYWGVGA